MPKKSKYPGLRTHTRKGKFYQVETYPALVEAQSRHIEKLQAKLPNTTGAFTTQKVREG